MGTTSTLPAATADASMAAPVSRHSASHDGAAAPWQAAGSITSGRAPPVDAVRRVCKSGRQRRRWPRVTSHATGSRRHASPPTCPAPTAAPTAAITGKGGVGAGTRSLLFGFAVVGVQRAGAGANAWLLNPRRQGAACHALLVPITQTAPCIAKLTHAPRWLVFLSN